MKEFEAFWEDKGQHWAAAVNRSNAQPFYQIAKLAWQQGQASPDFSASRTEALRLWKNPLFSLQERLLMADGAVAFVEQVLKNKDAQILELKLELAQLKMTNTKG